MKRIADLPIIIGLMIMICAILLSARITACAEEDYFSSDTDKLIDSLYSESGADDLMPALPDSTKDFLGRLYIDDFKPDSAEKLSLSSIISAVTYAVRENMIEPLRLAICIMGIILLTALFDTLKTSEFSAGLEQTLSFVSLICVSAVISPQIFSLITELTDTITACSDFMIIYIPVITILIIAGGKIISGGMFYSTMIYMSSGMMRVVSEIVVPFLKCITSLAVITNITDKPSLSGISEMFKKAVRILLTFCMSVFTAFLSMKSVISVSQDTLSDRAIKFTVSNFVPIVGGALSDVYQTVVSCTAVLKSGVGVVAVIAVFAVFVPAVLKCMIWELVLMVCTAVCDVFSNSRLSSLLNSFSAVISVICSILLSAMAIYVISTAIILIVGG